MTGIALTIAIGAAFLAYLIGWYGGIAEGRRKAQRRYRVQRNLDTIRRSTRSPW